jgi:hypothetical protein
MAKPDYVVKTTCNQVYQASPGLDPSYTFSSFLND